MLVSSFSVLEHGAAVARVRIVERLTTNTLATYVWPAALVLAAWVWENRRAHITDHTVIELGCGTGLVGLVARAAGASLVRFTDVDVDALRDLHTAVAIGDASSSARSQTTSRINNVDTCASSMKGPAGVVIEPLRWGDTVAAAALSPHNVILGADVLYDSCAHEGLLQTVRELLLRARAADCCSGVAPASFVTAYQVRTSTKTIAPLLAEFGLQARLLPLPSTVIVAKAYGPDIALPPPLLGRALTSQPVALIEITLQISTAAA